MAGGLKMWGLNDPVSHDDLNTNFNLLLLRIIAVEQAIATGAITSGSGSPGTALVFSSGEIGLFSDGSTITLSS